MRLVASTNLSISYFGEAAADPGARRLVVCKGAGRSVLILGMDLSVEREIVLPSKVKSPLAFGARGERIGAAMEQEVVLLSSDGTEIGRYAPGPGQKGGAIGPACAFSLDGELFWLVRGGLTPVLEVAHTRDGQLMDSAPLGVGSDASFYFVRHPDGRTLALVAAEGQNAQATLWFQMKSGRIEQLGSRTQQGEMLLAFSRSGALSASLAVMSDSFVIRESAGGTALVELSAADVFGPGSTASLFGSPPVFLDERSLLAITSESRWIVIDIRSRSAVSEILFDGGKATVVPWQSPGGSDAPGTAPSYCKAVTWDHVLTSDASDNIALWDIGSLAAPSSDGSTGEDRGERSA